MACSSTQKIRFQLRRATEQQWYDTNPTLLEGEPAVSTDIKQIKIGNGNTWRNTDYINLTGITGAVGTPTTLAVLIVLTATSKVGTEVRLQNTATLQGNQPVLFTSPITASGGGGNIVANQVYFVFASTSNNDKVLIKTSVAGTTAY